MSLKIYTGLREFYSKYDYFLIDLWGVVHNGHNLLPGVDMCISNLKAHKKNILFLTNSPRPGYVLEAHLKELGLPLDGPRVYSSGDSCLQALKENWAHKSCYFLGDPVFHESIVKAIPGPVVTSIEKADYVLMTGIPGTTAYVIEESLKLGLPLICANPDKSAIHGTTQVMCPGTVADDYEKQGGKVYYFGKPYPSIYEQALKNLGPPPKDKVLAIGDGLFTDILGATGVGIDCVFIQAGLYHSLSLESIEKICKDNQMMPTYGLERLNW
ncbi:MAG: TIGR01459 family HAD-type hydrolase [Alphaproteobacteria bacterium]